MHRVTMAELVEVCFKEEVMVPRSTLGQWAITWYKTTTHRFNKGHVGGNMHQGGGPVFSFSTNKQFNSGSVGGNMVQNQDYDGHFGREQESCKNSFGKIMRENEGWIVENDDGSSDMCTCKIGGKKSCEPM